MEAMRAAAGAEWGSGIQPQRGAIRQPRAKPWEEWPHPFRSPERAQPESLRVSPFQGLAIANGVIPRASPWADELRPVRAEFPALLTRSPDFSFVPNALGEWRLRLRNHEKSERNPLPRPQSQRS